VVVVVVGATVVGGVVVAVVAVVAVVRDLAVVGALEVAPVPHADTVTARARTNPRTAGVVVRAIIG